MAALVWVYPPVAGGPHAPVDGSRLTSPDARVSFSVVESRGFLLLGRVLRIV